MERTGASDEPQWVVNFDFGFCRYCWTLVGYKLDANFRRRVNEECFANEVGRIKVIRCVEKESHPTKRKNGNNRGDRLLNLPHIISVHFAFLRKFYNQLVCLRVDLYDNVSSLFLFLSFFRNVMFYELEIFTIFKTIAHTVHWIWSEWIFRSRKLFSRKTIYLLSSTSLCAHIDLL